MRNMTKNPVTLSELARPVQSRGWRVESYVRALAGAFIILSVVLAVTVSEWWLLFTLFAGLNLLQSSVSGWCMMSNLLALAFPSLREE